MKSILRKSTLMLLFLGLLTFNNSPLKAQTSTKTVKLEVKGMACQNSCANGLDRTFNETDGIIKSQTSYDKSSSEITYDPTLITETQIITIIEKRGFITTVMKEGTTACGPNCTSTCCAKK
ncbi:MAG: cation transporter [Flavobacteriales bacterium]|nr:cation transporter [Flavobacteriales bacterium]